MITFGLVDEDQVMKSICVKRGVAYDSDLSAYMAFEEASLLGVCIFSINGTNGKIVLCDTQGQKLLHIEDGFVRAILSYMMKHKVHEVTCNAAIEKSILTNLGFTPLDESWKLSLDGYSFKKC